MSARTVTRTARSSSASIAGFTFLFYIAVGVAQMFVGAGSTGGEGAAAKLASMAEHAPQVRINVLLGLLTCFAALVLAVTLYNITQEQGRGLALFALACRIAEGVNLGVPQRLG